MALKPTNSELEILRLMWRNGPSTVRFINERLNESKATDQKPTGYTTTLKLMQIMFEKGLLDREREGKTHIYRALISEKETQKQLVDKLMDAAFQGSAMKMVMQALGRKTTTQEELEKIKQYLDQLSNDNPKEENK